MRWNVFFLLLFLHIAGLGLFCIGFFPSKNVLEGYSEASSNISKPQFSKLVVMVVDALRSDFVFSNESSMFFVQDLLRSGEALGFTAYSNPPTVTLPRLKGITTGSTPNFLDAVFNVVEGDSSSTLSHQDSWVTQLKRAGKKVHMYGDDTWLKLFPSTFDVVEGTSSFFVTDFTEVDNNVTRNIDAELKDASWDCLILHYLGLDHIGHRGGPRSIFMSPKQTEMDSIVQRIYENLEQDTLFILLGDHGMNEVGNHGGASSGETSASLVFLSKKIKKLELNSTSPLPPNQDYLFYSRIFQIDIVPTISGLLNLPIPRNNLGVFIRDFLPLFNEEDSRAILLENAQQLSLLSKEEFDIKSFDQLNDEEIYEYLFTTQQTLTTAATNYDYSKMILGVGTVATVSLCLGVSTMKYFGLQSLIYFSLIILYGITSFGSSLIEEEYQFWWWISLVFSLAIVKVEKTSGIILLIALRILRGWNNSGEKFIGDSCSEFLSKNPESNWALVILTLSAYAFRLANGGLQHVNPLLSFLLSFVLSALCLSFKLFSSITNGERIPSYLSKFVTVSLDVSRIVSPKEGLVDIAYTFYIVLSATLIFRIIFQRFGLNAWYFTDIHTLLSLLLIFVTPVTNIPIFGVLLIVKYETGVVFGRLQTVGRFHKIGLTSLFCIILSNLTFFSFGITNSLSKIDLSNAYNGISSYNMIAVGFLMFISNFAGPLYWSFASLSILLESQRGSKIIALKVFKIKWTIEFLFFSISTLFVLVACTILRYHLFIWTVFSPKLLFSFAWNVFMNLFVETFCLGLVSIY